MSPKSKGIKSSPHDYRAADAEASNNVWDITEISCGLLERSCDKELLSQVDLDLCEESSLGTRGQPEVSQQLLTFVWDDSLENLSLQIHCLFERSGCGVV